MINQFSRTLHIAVLSSAIIISSAISLTGCAGLRMERNYAAPVVRSPAQISTWALYPLNRVLDLLDIASVGVMVGPGLNARVETTSVLGLCFPTNSAGVEVGWNTHWIDDLEAESDGAYLPYWSRYRPVAMGVHGGKDLPLPIFSVEMGELEQSPDTIAVGVHLLIIGVHLGIRPMEIADLIAGFAFIDINRDDIHHVPEEEREPKDPTPLIQ